MFVRRLVLPLLLVTVAAASAAPQRTPPDRRATAQPPFVPTAAGAPDLSPFRGPGMWVDIYDSKALSDPRGAARDMAAHGIRTLYLQTGNWRRPYAVVHPKQDAQLIEAAHAHGMKVVTWYLPKFENVDDDFRRVMRSIELTTPKGQRPDAFGLDIEAAEVEPKQRIENLLTLSARLRAEVGTGYALGAIIPSPRGMIRVSDYWPGFPYQRIPEFYDLIMPMSYYTFHYDGGKPAHKYISDNIRIIRERTGRVDVPIHPIGGLTADTSMWEAEAVVRAARERGVTGVSLYEYGDMTGALWAALRQMPVQPGVQTPSPAPLPQAEAVGYLPKGDRRHPKEAFFSTRSLGGPMRLSFRAFDAGEREIRIFVNGRLFGSVWHGPQHAWTDTRRRVIPTNILRRKKVNVISFVAAGNFPRWSTWGVRDVAVEAA